MSCNFFDASRTNMIIYNKVSAPNQLKLFDTVIGEMFCNLGELNLSDMKCTFRELLQLLLVYKFSSFLAAFILPKDEFQLLQSVCVSV